MIFTIENDYVAVSVKKEGAELSSFKSKETQVEYLWQGNPDIWYGQSPVLFPIVGTLLNNSYLSDGKEYTLYRHGIARKRDFELKEQGNDYLILVQRYNEDTLKVYPFKYELTIEFRLDGKSLTVNHYVKTLGDKAMHFSIGAHPGFNCNIGDCLEFEKEETNVVCEMIDEDAVLYDKHFTFPMNGKSFIITEHIFDKDAYVISNLKSKTCTLKTSVSNTEVKFTFGDAPYLGLWAKPGAPYICIEPWYGINDSREKKDDISQKRAIQTVKPGEEFKFSWSALIKE